ncbi:hypothetical protein POM88_020994 [Heracleum sosnowskyi]|uniref:Uncharacterized protein n=1 Tax=Heracleum sosnowskyi TaxID=360622 RepID=A0AAD8ICJ7_9APIA|nr:hypothetical protein POM88_020994 [Heracleum sosnowskyi]
MQTSGQQLVFRTTQCLSVTNCLEKKTYYDIRVREYNTSAGFKKIATHGRRLAKISNSAYHQHVTVAATVTLVFDFLPGVCFNGMTGSCEPVSGILCPLFASLVFEILVLGR